MEFVVVKNPYASSSVSPNEANDKHIRAQLMVIIRKMIQERGLNQRAAAELLGTTQPRVSEIINGKLDNHTIDRLFSMLNTLGWDFKFGYSGGVVTATAELSCQAA
ncbi:helix-turn-helix domain-containing protein [Edwardsiella tarda]|uniref:Helix-turn-helix domain-containing protein n=1 Tax=Edwardsiella tarda ATCC 15947 = NBRC 105688 TaxID=667121 RepID=A0AC61THT6_EDWTA|nr:helix-turn-helix transcriptional regulator [Edwardsiella tarda]UAL56659.1 helix-turn-helix domain-containing protein [Edwardsiella tarda]UCQ00287.1 helix-turn-helix domain-containing protein [Edwardsiella tarda ATCC 15947 = NBRC 105688]